MYDGVESTPGTKALETMNSLHKDLVFKKPLGTARKRKKTILDDETYVEVRADCGVIKICFQLSLF